MKRSFSIFLLALVALPANASANGEPGYEALEKNPASRDDRRWNGQGDPQRPDCEWLAERLNLEAEGFCEHWAEAMNRKWSH